MTELDVQRQTEAESGSDAQVAKTSGHLLRRELPTRITRCRARPARTVDKATAAHFAIAALSDAEGYTLLRN